jgi:hypothetical protein
MTNFPVTGHLSDHFGRKWIALIGMIEIKEIEEN